MKLKVKLPLLFSVIVIVLAIALVAYIRFDVVGVIMTRVSYMQQQYVEKDQEIPDTVSSLYPDMKAINQYIEKRATEDEISITLYDQDLSIVHQYQGYATDEGPVNPLENWYPIKIDDNSTELLLQVQRPLYPQMIIMQTIYLRVFFYLVIFLSLIFIALTIFFHYSITQPIQNLNRRLSNIKNFSYYRPVSVRRKDEIGELYSHFFDMQEKLSQANKEQIDMIAAITHDIKTPLTSMNGFIELLTTNKMLTEKDKEEYIKLLGKKSKDITNLIDEFSSYAKNEVLLPSISFESVSVKQFFESVAKEYEAELSGFDYQLIWSHRFREEQSFLINPSMIRRVFANLISNAVRYAQKDDLIVYLKGYAEKEKVHFIVEDNGIGVPENVISNLFERFFTVDKSRQTEAGGTGLGLASCKSIIERHGGSIKAFHSAHGGLGVAFTIPVDKDKMP